jgi:hypothetical protein
MAKSRGVGSATIQAFGRLRVAITRGVKVVRAKNHSCKCLIVNGVKPGQGKSNQLCQRVKVADWAAKFAGLGSEQRWQEVNLAGELGDNTLAWGVSYCQILSDKVSYIHLWSHIRQKFFSQCPLATREPGDFLPKPAKNRGQPGSTGLFRVKPSRKLFHDDPNPDGLPSAAKFYPRRVPRLVSWAPLGPLKNPRKFA